MKAFFYVMGAIFFLIAAWFGFSAAMFVFGGTLLDRGTTGPGDGISGLMSLWMFSGQAQLAVLSAIACGVFLSAGAILEELQRRRD